MAFLRGLAVRLHVSASTQNQAFNALLFLYWGVLHLELVELVELVELGGTVSRNGDPWSLTWLVRVADPRVPLKIGKHLRSSHRRRELALRELQRPQCGVMPTLKRSLLVLILGLCPQAYPADRLEQGWANPPTDARIRAYWWWLNGQVTREAITRDLEAMKARGWGGALICDAGGAEQDGNEPVPHGPTFFSPEWRGLYRHALREADRLGLEMSLNIQSGWNLGGPMVTADDAAKKLVWSESRWVGPKTVAERLPAPRRKDDYYRDLFVVAYPRRSDGAPAARRLLNWEQKALHKALHFSAPDTTPLLVELPASAGEEDARAAAVVDLTERLGADGVLRWEVPEGTWEVLRFGCTLGDHATVSTSSDGWKGYAVDPLDAEAFRRYWDAVVEPLIVDAGPLAGRTLKYLHTDSWEVEAVNWTRGLRDAFRQRRGYDWLPYLPVLAGRIVESRPVSNRFLHDFRRTLGDLARANYYGPFQEGARRHGLQLHPESGGPHAVPIDAQQCLGANDVPMSEFWAWSWRHRVGDSNRFFLKQPASAAHTYGRKLVAAEGFTTIGPHWQETLWDNLKPAFDKALGEGMNLLFWHAFVCSPAEMGMPGIQYFAGTHFNPNTTWWRQSGPFVDYLNRCQWMMQQGRFVADVLYYYGDHVPNFAQLKASDPARVLPGYDYDVISEEALVQRVTVRDGRLTLPDGTDYALLVLPDRPAISLPVLRTVGELVRAGATVVGSRSVTATGLTGYPACDGEVAELATRLWGAEAGPSEVERTVGQGRVVSGRSARAVLGAGGIPPDFEFTADGSWVGIDYLHRREGGTDIYFVANRSNRWATARCTFRVAGRAPELWDAVTGRGEFATAYELQGERTVVPLQFAPCGSWFVVFRHPASAHPPSGEPNHLTLVSLQEIRGPWNVRFDPVWGGPESARFEELVSWPQRPEPGIRHYSGTATYATTFEWKPANERGGGTEAGGIWLDLGSLRELAEVRLNGRSLGVVWAPPFRVAVTGVVQRGENRLEVDVVNFWPNRLIGDAGLPVEQRRTRTNIRKLTAETALMESGLLGPVRLMVSARGPR